MDQLLHIPTVLFTNAVACLCISISLVLIWRSARSETYILFWSIGYGFGVGAMLFAAVAFATEGRPDTTGFQVIISPGTLLLAAFGAFWLGYRRFAGHSGWIDAVLAAAGVLIWLAFALDDGAFSDTILRARVNALLELGYLLAIIVGLLRDNRAAPSAAVGLTAVLLLIHAVKLAAGALSIGLAASDPFALVKATPVFGSLGLIETSIFAVFLGLLQLVLISQRSQQRLRVAAETDQLTGLANRRHFLDRSLPHLAGARDRGALILFDIDHFKRVNDTYGHPAGDRALVRFAAALTATAPAGSIAARLGGEEFALFLPEGTLSEAGLVAEHVRRTVAGLRIATAAGDVRLTVSGGVAAVSETGADYDALHAAADGALYAAKHDGRDRVVVHQHRPGHGEAPPATRRAG